MKEFNVNYTFQVNGMGLGAYLKDAPYAVSSFRDRDGNITIYPVNTLLENEHNDLVLYVSRYTQEIQTMLVALPMTEQKLLSILTYYISESAKFASENSIMMTQLGYTTEQKIAFVSKAVSDFEPIKKHIEMFSYYVIWGMFDAIVRDDILTEERITSLKNGLYSKIFEV